MFSVRQKQLIAEQGINPDDYWDNYRQSYKK